MPFLIYLVQVFLYSGALWTIYCVALRGKSNHRGSRAYLLLAALLPLLLPFIRFNAVSTNNGWMPHYQLPDFQVAANSVTAPHIATSAWSIYYAYAFIAMVLVCFYAAGYIRILRTVAKGKRKLIEGNTVYINTGIGPGTIGRYVFFPGQTYDEQILRHEKVHIHAGHRYDLLLMQVLTAAFWVNPFSWIILRELKMVHEFEADAHVLDGKNISAYTDLLLSEVFGLRRTNIVHSFYHHPIKRRLMMLQNKQNMSRIRRQLAGAILSTVLVCISIILIQCKREKQAPKSDTVISGIDARISGIGTRIYSMKDEVDTMPEFAGNLSKYLMQNLRYPENARKDGKEGRAVIKFVVADNGHVENPTIVRTSGTPSLDSEALRVVSSLPPWKPAMLNGRPVDMLFTLPISFKLGG